MDQQSIQQKSRETPSRSRCESGATNPLRETDARRAPEGPDRQRSTTGVDGKEFQTLSYATHRGEVKDWLLRFAACVRSRDYETAMTMFAPNVTAFGTRTRLAKNLQALVSEQWEKTWPRTSGFQFNFEELNFFHDEHMAHVAVTWKSIGNQFAIRRKRTGRASLLLIGHKKELRCAASHFSLDP